MSGKSNVRLELAVVPPDDAFLDMQQTELDRYFRVDGRFYVFPGAAVTYPCRDLLEIRRHQASTDSGCDAVFIMMNPGSSKPLKAETEANRDNAIFFPAKPDTTQYQLMRLMGVLGWDRVKVLNLSDLRERRSKDFFRLVGEFVDREGHDARGQ